MTERPILSGGDRRLLRDCAVCGFALIGPAPEQLTHLVRAGLLEWHWNGGVPIYEVTAAGRVAYGERTTETR